MGGFLFAQTCSVACLDTLMAANSLRGGKNIYGPKSLMSNWFEERMEPQHEETAVAKTIQLPPKTAKTWNTTSGAYGEDHKEAMQKAIMGTETGNWLNYQKHEG